ncbi:MAG: hypothetical protein ACHQQS_06615 [Thermoanaerobaculales bacterium]
MSIIERDAGGRFVPGTPTPNSGGRPAIAKVFRQRCREFMEEDEGGWKKLIALARGRGQVAFRALELVAAYAYGRPAQRLEHTGGDGAPIGVETSLLMTKLSALIGEPVSDPLPAGDGATSPALPAGEKPRE